MTIEPWVRFASEAPIEKFEAFLTSKGFLLKENLGKFGAIYQNKDGSILLPLSRDLDDYTIRIAEAVDSLSLLIGESRDLIAKLISSVGFDALKIRTGIGSESFSVDLDDALDTLHNGYAIIDYSAVYASSEDPPSYIKGRRANKVAAYLDSVRMGQTEPGSFVLTLLLPTVSNPDLAADKIAPLSLGQRVSDVIVASLENSSEAMADDKRFEEQSRPLSANFLSALAEIVSNSPSVEIGVDQRSRNQFQRVLFRRSDEESLREYAEVLTPKVETWNDKVVGTVVNVTEERGQRNGYFVLECLVKGSRKHVKIGFLRNQRQQIIQAFDEKSEFRLSARGQISRNYSGRLSMDNPADIQLINRGSLA